MHHGQLITIGLALAIATAPAVRAQTPGVPTTPAPQGVLARSGTPAPTFLAEAVKAAKASKKLVLAYYVASREFADTFVNSAEAGKLLADNYVVVRLVGYEFNRGKDAEPINPKTDSVMVALGGTKPILHFLVLDSTGAKLDGVGANSVGQPDPAEFGELLAKTAPGMTAADRKRITDYLAAQGRK